MKLDFSTLSLTESDIELLSEGEDEIKIVAKNVLVVSGDLNETVDAFLEVLIRFQNVVSSRRRLFPYKNKKLRKGFHEALDIENEWGTKEGLHNMECEFEGVLLDPLSWIDSWVIRCGEVHVEVLQK